jgi:hypothetical protein
VPNNKKCTILDMIVKRQNERNVRLGLVASKNKRKNDEKIFIDHHCHLMVSTHIIRRDLRLGKLDWRDHGNGSAPPDD